MTRPIEDVVADLRRIDETLPEGPWELWTSCSYRRIKGPHGRGDVLSAYNQRSDGHPDLSMPEEKLAELVALRNMLPAIADILLSQAREVERLREQIETPEQRAEASYNAMWAKYGKPKVAWSDLSEEVRSRKTAALDDVYSAIAAPAIILALQQRLEAVEGALAEIAKGEAPPQPHGHYLAHRAAVDLARKTLSAIQPVGGE